MIDSLQMKKRLTLSVRYVKELNISLQISQKNLYLSPKMKYLISLLVV